MSIDELIAQGEGQTIEFKYEINSSRKIAETIAAFANADGGMIFVGVKDNGKAAGVRNDEEIYMIESASSMACKPEVKLSFQSHEFQGKNIIAVRVEKSNEEIIRARSTEDEWIVYIRIGAGNYKAILPFIRFLELKNREMHFGDKEKQVLDTINAFGLLTFNQLSKKVKINRIRLADALSKLMRWGTVNFKLLNGEFFFISNRSLPENADELRPINHRLLDCFDNS